MWRLMFSPLELSQWTINRVEWADVVECFGKAITHPRKDIPGQGDGCMNLP